MAKYTIAGREFRSQNAILAHVSEVKARYADKVDLSPEDFRFMFELLHGHPDARQKIGPGVRRMWVQSHEGLPGRGFVLERLDGSTDRFSPRKCVVPTSRTQEVCGAFRWAIYPQIVKFRRDYFRRHADADGTVPDPFGFGRVTEKDCHVDHGPYGFRTILDQFLLSKRLQEADVKLTKGPNNTPRLADKGLEQEWVHFHELRAELQIASSEGNSFAGSLAAGPTDMGTRVDRPE
jgi:hypothetical protein